MPDCGCVPNMQDGGFLKRCSTHTQPRRCDYVLPGLGRCLDTSGMVHGHHFKPGSSDQALLLSSEEAHALVDYLQQRPLENVVLRRMFNRIETHVRVTA